MKKILLLIVIVATLGCSTTNDEQPSTEAFIRLANKSSVELKNVSFNGVNYGDLAPGALSEYHRFDKSYSYGPVDLLIDGKQFGWTPYDYVGEEPLKAGKYVYEFSYDAKDESLTAVMVAE